MSGSSESPPTGATVSVLMLLPFVRLLEESEPEQLQAGFDHGERTLARWGVTRAELEADPLQRLPYGLMLELLLGFTEILGDPSAPLRAGMLQEPGDFELIEYLSASCATLGDAIACVGRYYALLGPVELELHIEGDRAESRFRVTAGLDAPDALYEFAIASNFAVSILHIQLEGVQMPIEVCFTHSAPAHVDAFAEIFMVPVRFNCEHNAIVFPVSMVDHPMAKPDAMLHSVLTRLAELELEALTDRSAFPSQVREAIDVELASGASLESVAARLHMSPSTLRSRLTHYGTNYSALLDGLRRDHAKRALRKSQASFSELAHDLGFSHPPAFHRAVKRWFGMTPAEYRELPSTHKAARLWRKRE